MLLRGRPCRPASLPPAAQWDCTHDAKKLKPTPPAAAHHPTPIAVHSGQSPFSRSFSGPIKRLAHSVHSKMCNVRESEGGGGRSKGGRRAGGGAGSEIPKRLRIFQSKEITPDLPFRHCRHAAYVRNRRTKIQKRPNVKTTEKEDADAEKGTNAATKRRSCSAVRARHHNYFPT